MCNSTLSLAQSTCIELGFLVAREKPEGPATVLTFLGIEIDTVAMELRLPADKLARLHNLIDHWLNKRAASKRELQSIIGHLSHAATVVQPGRTFLCMLTEASKIPKQPDHLARLNTQCRADIGWWSLFFHHWNGRSYMPSEEITATLTSDASGSWGYGAIASNHHWFQLKWPSTWSNSNIALM